MEHDLLGFSFNLYELLLCFFVSGFTFLILMICGTESMVKNIKILLIEDNLGDVYLIEEYLEEFATFSYEINHVGTLNEAFSVLNKQLFDVILLDLELPDSYGINTFLSIHNKSLEIPIIILTGLNDEKVGVFAIEEGAYEFLVKGQMECRLIEYIRQCYMDLRRG